MNTRRILLSAAIAMALSLLCPDAVHAQSSDYDLADRIHIGLLGGMRVNSASFSDLNKRYVPSPSSVSSGMGGIFAEIEFGQSRTFSLRPELMMLSRDYDIKDIQYVTGTGVGELDYTARTKYVDVRMPLILNFGSYRSIRPYLYVAPVLGFATGGELKLEDETAEYAIDVTNANMSSYNIAGALGVGVKFPIHLSNCDIHVGLEASYEMGFTDTYGSKERDGKAFAYELFPVYHIEGTRKYSGIEVAANVSIPLSIFKKPKMVEPVRYVEPEPEIIPEPVVEKKEINVKPCYSLEEILDLLSIGQKVEGLTICAIDLVNFEYNKSTLTVDSRDYLDKIAALMIRTDVSIEVKGHTDNVGSEEYNMQLSKHRAEAVYKYLLSKGVNKDHLNYSYYGMSKPIESNDTEFGRKQNRRVEFEIK